MTRADAWRFGMFRAGAARFALAACTGLTGAASAQRGEAGPAGEERPTVGVLVVEAGQSALGERLLTVLGRLTAWAAGGSDPAWGGLGRALAGVEGAEGVRAWSVLIDDAAGLVPVGREGGESPAAQAVSFDLSLDCNLLRHESPQPFSRSVRGRVMDALQIDNARRVRLTGLSADPDDGERLTLVCFTESRAQRPGRCLAQPLAAVSPAPSRGEPTAPHPVQVDFGEQWGGVVFTCADLAISLDPASEALSTAERFETLGLDRAASVRLLAGAFEGRVWLWPSAGGGVVFGLPISRASTDRRTAEAMRAVFARRLSWGRDEAGRATGTLALVRENRPAGERDLAVSLRFVKIAARTTLVIATDAADLDSAAEVLATIPP